MNLLCQMKYKNVAYHGKQLKMSILHYVVLLI
jgi:hypothetical protein